MSDDKAKSIPEGQRQCTTCSKIQPIANFHRDAKGKDGRKSKCKKCRAAKSKGIEAIAETSKSKIELDLDELRKGPLDMSKVRQILADFAAEQERSFYPPSNKLRVPSGIFSHKEHEFAIRVNVKKYFNERTESIDPSEILVTKPANFRRDRVYEVTLPAARLIDWEGSEKILRLCEGDTFVDKIIIPCDLESIPAYREICFLVDTAFAKYKIPKHHIYMMHDGRNLILDWGEEVFPEQKAMTLVRRFRDLMSET